MLTVAEFDVARSGSPAEPSAFWRAYYRWHLATEHRWDAALWSEAMAMQLDALGKDLAEALAPALNAAAEAMRGFAAAYAAAYPKEQP